MAYKKLNEYLASLELAKEYTPVPTDLPESVMSEVHGLIDMLKILGASLSDLQYLGIEGKNMVCRPRVYKQDGKLVLFFHPGCVVDIPSPVVFIDGKVMLLEESDFELRVKTGIDNPPQVASYNTILKALPDKVELVKNGKFLDLLDELGEQTVKVTVKGVYQKQFDKNLAYSVLAMVDGYPQRSGFYKTTAKNYQILNEGGVNREYRVSRKDWNIGGKVVNSHEFRLVK